MSRESTRIHRRVPKLPVSPSRSPSSASWSVGAAHVDCTLWDAEETSTTDLYDAYREEAGSNLAALPRGPKIGVHLNDHCGSYFDCYYCNCRPSDTMCRSNCASLRTPACETCFV